MDELRSDVPRFPGQKLLHLWHRQTGTLAPESVRDDRPAAPLGPCLLDHLAVRVEADRPPLPPDLLHLMQDMPHSLEESVTGPDVVLEDQVVVSAGVGRQPCPAGRWPWSLALGVDHYRHLVLHATRPGLQLLQDVGDGRQA